MWLMLWYKKSHVGGIHEVTQAFLWPVVEAESNITSKFSVETGVWLIFQSIYNNNTYLVETVTLFYLRYQLHSLLEIN